MFTSLTLCHLLHSSVVRWSHHCRWSPNVIFFSFVSLGEGMSERALMIIEIFCTMSPSAAEALATDILKTHCSVSDSWTRASLPFLCATQRGPVEFPASLWGIFWNAVLPSPVERSFPQGHRNIKTLPGVVWRKAQRRYSAGVLLEEKHFYTEEIIWYDIHSQETNRNRVTTGDVIRFLFVSWLCL